jgi:hypothetical protein
LAGSSFLAVCRGGLGTGGSRTSEHESDIDVIAGVATIIAALITIDPEAPEEAIGGVGFGTVANLRSPLALDRDRNITARGSGVYPIPGRENYPVVGIEESRLEPAAIVAGIA